jgi:hypothetical protein
MLSLQATFGLGELRIVAFRLPVLLLIFYLKFKIKFFDEYSSVAPTTAAK